jgi:hypothetical protein
MTTGGPALDYARGKASCKQHHSLAKQKQRKHSGLGMPAHTAATHNSSTLANKQAAANSKIHAARFAACWQQQQHLGAQQTA